MQLKTTGMVFLTSLAFLCSAYAAQAPAAAGRAVVAAAKVPMVTDAPRFFKVVSVTLPAGATSTVTGPSGVLYQISGATQVSVGGETKTINAGEGIYIGAGAAAQLKSGDEGPSTFFHYFLAPRGDLDRPAESANATVTEIYRSAAPIPDLKDGAYELNLTRVTFPAGMPSNAPHHRLGAALYYIVSGVGANTIDGNVTAKGPGTFIYEPYSLVHQWGNPGSEPMTFLTFNINPEGVAAVLQGAPAKN